MVAVAWAAIGLLAATLVSSLFYLGSRIDALGARLDVQGSSLGTRIDALDERLGNRIDALSARIDGLSASTLADAEHDHRSRKRWYGSESCWMLRRQLRKFESRRNRRASRSGRGSGRRKQLRALCLLNLMR